MRLAIPTRLSPWIALALTGAACAGAGPPPEPRPLAADAPICPSGGALPPMDVVVAIDTSRSTRDPTGLDIDGDGRVGEFRRSRWTDRGDSVLAAQVAAVRRVVRATQGSGVRFAVVAYAGRQERVLEDSTTQFVDRRDAKLRAELTSDVVVLERALEALQRRGSNGYSSFAPPMQLALRALRYPPDAAPAETARILFLSDSPEPIRQAPGGHYAWQDRRMRTQAIRAVKAGVAFDTFGLGEAARAGTPHTLTHIASATGGSFHSVFDADQLHCTLLEALRAPRRYGVADGR